MYNMVRRQAIVGMLSLALLMNGCTFPWSSKRPTPPPSSPPTSEGPPPTAPAPIPSPAPAPTPTPGKAVWIDASASPFPVRGIIEGFYGAPWSQEKRLNAFDFMARVGMNTYVYAPKDDPYQRADWRKLYPEAELGRFRALLERGGQDGIDFVYSISPGLDITYSGDADRRALAAKLDQLRGLGIHTVMLSVDDVVEELNPADTAVYGNNFALAQAEMVNWLYAHERASDPKFVLWMAESHYWGTKSDPYLTTLGDNLDPAVQLIWTGPDVLSTTMTTADADAFAAMIKRKPIIWDNYPVNDYTYVMKKKPRLIMGPVLGRAADLGAHASGYLINPMIQEEASLLPMYTTAAYLARPSAYDPQAAWRDGASHLTNNPEAAAALLELASFAQISAVTDLEAPALTQAIAAYWNGASGSAEQLKRQFTAMTSLPDRLKGAVSPGFYAEVSPWVEAVAHKGEAGLLALEVDSAVRGQDAGTVRQKLPGLRQKLAAMQAEQATAYIGVQLVEDFATQVIQRAELLAK